MDFPILAEIIEEMMLSRYHLTSDDERWSKEALDFLSCTLEGSFESLINIRSCLISYIPKQTLIRIALLLEEGYITKGVNTTPSICP